MSSSALLARGTPLTPVMELTGPNGVQWVAYVEGVPPVRRWRFLSETLLPGRRMRFDSVDESRVNPTVPVGSPFLTERRLQTLLAGATSLPRAAQVASGALLRRHRRELLPAAGRAWSRLCDTAAGVSRAGVHWLLSGHQVSSGWIPTAHDHLLTGTATTRSLHLRATSRLGFPLPDSGLPRIGLHRPNRGACLESVRVRLRSAPGRLPRTGDTAPRSTVKG